MKIGICDDDRSTVKSIVELVRSIDNSSSLSILEFYEGDELYENISEGNIFDLIFLDIKLTNEDGIEVAKKIREIDKSVVIIFITAYSEFAISAFEVNAFRYLTKPIDKEIFKNYYNLALKKIEESSQYISFKFNKKTFRIDANDIIYFESRKRVTYIKTKDGERKCYGKLNTIEEMLVKRGIIFFRTSQSLLLNPIYIYSYGTKEITLKNDEIIPIANSKRETIGKLFCDMKCGDIIV